MKDLKELLKEHTPHNYPHPINPAQVKPARPDVDVLALPYDQRTPYEAGRVAWLKRYGINPNIPGSREYQEWNAGWLSAAKGGE